MTDLVMNVVKEEHSPVEETDDSCLFKYFEVVPLATDTDGSSTRECASGDCSADVRQELLPAVKEETRDVCWFCYSTDIFNFSQQKQFLHILVNIYICFINSHFLTAAFIANC